MRFSNTSRVVTVRYDDVDNEWLVMSLVSDAWVPAPVPDFYSWEDVQDFYSNRGQGVRYSTPTPVCTGL